MCPAVSVKVVVASSRNSVMRSAFWVEHDEPDGQRVARRTAPVLRVRSAHAFVQFVATGEDRAFAPVMMLVGCHVPDRAVAVSAVIPSDEASHPAVRGREVGEGQPRVRWRVLQRAKQRL